MGTLMPCYGGIVEYFFTFFTAIIAITPTTTILMIIVVRCSLFSFDFNYSVIIVSYFTYSPFLLLILLSL